MRRFTLQAFEDMLVFSDKTVFQNRTVARTAISLIRLDHRVNKVRDEELAKLEPQIQEWMESPKYTELQEKLNKAEDEDEYKNDDDPEGFKLYKSLVSDMMFPNFSLFTAGRKIRHYQVRIKSHCSKQRPRTAC